MNNIQRLNTPCLSALVSILTAHVNTHGRVDDAIICKEVAVYMMANQISVYNDDLYTFIYDHGEALDETYCGRDEDGEKVYQTFNPGTNWETRLHKELEVLGYWTVQAA